MQLAESEGHLLALDIDEERACVNQILRIDVVQVHDELPLMPPRLPDTADPMQAIEVHGVKVAEGRTQRAAWVTLPPGVR